MKTQRLASRGFLLLCNLPELGYLSRREIAALVGVAPFNWDSGRKIGNRIAGFGRREVRTQLYMVIIASMRIEDNSIHKLGISKNSATLTNW